MSTQPIDRPHAVPTLPDLADLLLLPGTVRRAAEALAESESLMGGLFLADPQAPAVFGRMQAAIAELLRTVGTEVSR